MFPEELTVLLFFGINLLRYLLNNREGVIPIAYVKTDENEPLERALKRFKRQVEKEGVIREFKRRTFFEKPSTIKARKTKAIQRKHMKKLRKVQSSKSY